MAPNCNNCHGDTQSVCERMFSTTARGLDVMAMAAGILSEGSADMANAAQYESEKHKLEEDLHEALGFIGCQLDISDLSTKLEQEAEIYRLEGHYG